VATEAADGAATTLPVDLDGVVTAMRRHCAELRIKGWQSRGGTLENRH
jgi:hypothetical protein